MLGPATRVFSRPSTIRSLTRAPTLRRPLSTAPPSQQSRSWKNYSVRVALAAGAIYYYNTNDVFAEEPAFRPRSADHENEPENLPTLEDLQEQLKQKRARIGQLGEQQDSTTGERSADKSNFAPGGFEGGIDDESKPGSVEELEEEAGQQGAFNPETGEINWDCPCLGGMAHDPCGEEFKAAFSCFVYSEAEPKGMDCVDKFQGMQTCFRQHPDVYGAELEEDEAYERERAQADNDGTLPDVHVPSSKEEPNIQVSGERAKVTEGEKVADRGSHYPDSDDSEVERKRQRAKAAKEQVRSRDETSESEAAVPRSSHSA